MSSSSSEVLYRNAWLAWVMDLQEAAAPEVLSDLLSNSSMWISTVSGPPRPVVIGMS